MKMKWNSSKKTGHLIGANYFKKFTRIFQTIFFLGGWGLGSGWVGDILSSDFRSVLQKVGSINDRY